MRLYLPEHRRTLQAFYGDDSEGYARALENLSSFLEKKVLPLSKDFDRKTRKIGDVRRELIEQGLSRMAIPLDRGEAVPFGVYTLVRFRRIDPTTAQAA